MTLLVDNQLPLALVRYLAANGWECTHVQNLGLEAAEDRTIWQYAKERGLAIITKDEDFQALANRQGSIPPQVVWVRLGNCRKAALLDAFSRILPELRDMLAAGDTVIEIR
jgi:predicted nuclease of predicted toxin-antitoxin system